MLFACLKHRTNYPSIDKKVKNNKIGIICNDEGSFAGFYPRDAMLARVIEIATCLSVCLSVRPSRAGIVSKRRNLAA